jgi:hypothetical protein
MAPGAPLPRPHRALEKVHIDIVFGDGLGRLGYRYTLVFGDRATRYIWVVGLKSLHADALIAAFAQFGLKPVAWRFNFGLIVILSFCLSKLCLGFVRMVRMSLRLQLVGSHPMVWSSVTGEQWLKWLGRI